MLEIFSKKKYQDKLLNDLINYYSKRGFNIDLRDNDRFEKYALKEWFKDIASLIAILIVILVLIFVR